MARWRPEPAQAAQQTRAPRRITGILLALLPSFLAAAESPPYFLRNHSPFLHGFGLPALEGGVLTSPGSFNSRIAVSFVNHADSSETANEAVVLDGESYYVDTILRYGLGERWEVGLDLPYVSHRNGKLDNLIEGWHDVFGLDNSEREGPSNHLQLTYRRAGIIRADVRDGGGGIGDVRVTSAYRLLSMDQGERTLALRGLLKLPTGNEERLRGSGATDMALSLEATEHATLAGRAMALTGQVGAIRLGDGELLPDAQKNTVPFAALGAMWRWSPALDLRVQLAVQGKYFDSALAEIGGSTATVAVGGAFHLRRLGLEVDIALIEDLISDATPDFGLYVSVGRNPTRSAGPPTARRGSP